MERPISSLDKVGFADWIMTFVRRYRWSAKYYGAPLTVCGAVLKILPGATRNRNARQWYKGAVSRRFDRAFNVDTCGYIPVSELDLTDESADGAVHYQPTESLQLGFILSQLDIRYQEYSFLDYGSGKGRVLIQAAHFPFREVIGVEVSRRLHEAAEDNICRLRRRALKCGNIRSVCEDARAFELPRSPLVLYFFHPFKQAVLAHVLAQIERSLERTPRHVVIVYQRPLGETDVSDPAADARHPVGLELTSAFENAPFLTRAVTRFTDPKWRLWETRRPDRRRPTSSQPPAHDCECAPAAPVAALAERQPRGR